jgi:hypothetical protein
MIEINPPIAADNPQTDIQFLQRTCPLLTQSGHRSALPRRNDDAAISFTREQSDRSFKLVLVAHQKRSAQ